MVLFQSLLYFSIPVVFTLLWLYFEIKNRKYIYRALLGLFAASLVNYYAIGMEKKMHSTTKKYYENQFIELEKRLDSYDFKSVRKIVDKNVKLGKTFD